LFSPVGLFEQVWKWILQLILAFETAVLNFILPDSWVDGLRRSEIK
jgi:hypothetical protein